MGVDWNIAVFCRNEQPYIERCLNSIADAIGDRNALTTIIVNGSSDSSAELAQAVARRRGLNAAIFTIAYGDKANAINQFLYRLRTEARRYFFVDGYATISRTAFSAMNECLTTRPDVVAATGVALNGRTMRLRTADTLALGGQLHGQLHALRRDFIDRMVTRGIRIPIGLYYGDGLVGSMAMHDLDPIGIEWQPKRIAGSVDATYEIPALSWLRPHDLRRQFNRKIRQMRGRLENAAISDIVYEHGYEGLPEYSDIMIGAFLAKHGVPPVSLQNRPFMALALRHHRAFTLPDPAKLVPTEVARI